MRACARAHVRARAFARVARPRGAAAPRRGGAECAMRAAHTMHTARATHAAHATRAARRARCCYAFPALFAFVVSATVHVLFVLLGRGLQYPTPPAGPCVWRLLQLRCAPATVRLWVIHIRTVAGLLPGAQLGIVTAAAPTICQPSSTASTVAILAQGTKWADALPQAFFQTAASDSARGRKPGHPPWEFSGLATCNFYLNGCLRSRSGEAPIV